MRGASEGAWDRSAQITELQRLGPAVRVIRKQSSDGSLARDKLVDDLDFLQVFR